MSSASTETGRPEIGVGVVLLRDGKDGEKEVLLVRRGKPPMQGQWSIPGGRQEWAETVRDAACREVREETGLHIEILGLIDVVDALIKGVGDALSHHYTLVDFAALAVGGQLQAGSDATAVQWVPVGQIDDYLPWVETRRIIREAVHQFP